MNDHSHNPTRWRRFKDWLLPPRAKVCTYRISGFKADGTSPVWACGMSPQIAASIYKSMGGDISKATWE